MNLDELTISVVGAGLAGSEAAFQLAEKGFQVSLFEMRPQKMTPAHKTADFAELVCSNSFGSVASHSMSGQLKWEAEKMGSFILETAGQTQVPAGQALGIDRKRFAREITKRLLAHPRVKIIQQEITSLDEIPKPCIIATGPLTGDSLAQSLLRHFGDEFLYFFDAIAPVVESDSIDMETAWIADRFDRGSGSYINCAMNKEQYYHFIEEVQKAEKTEPKDFEKDTPFFEACMPIEEMVRRGPETLRFGPLSPKGLRHPTSAERPYAVVQLRQENNEATAFNMVGFQTKMKYFEQKRILRMIPGLEKAEFLKLGSIHRNMYINPTQKLNPDLSSQNDPSIFFAGQITGVEGYFESTCIGLLVAHFVAAKVQGQIFYAPPRESALGALHHVLTGEKKDHFQPTNINMGLFPPLEKRMRKRDKRDHLVLRAKQAFSRWQQETEVFHQSQPFIEDMALALRELS